jgi:hypothetical protein
MLFNDEALTLKSLEAFKNSKAEGIPLSSNPK